MNTTDPEDLYERVRDLLADARGAGNAVTIDALARAAGASRRDIEELLETRLAEFPWPLVAGPRGYHQPATADEINAYLESLQRRAIAIFRRKRTVIRQAAATRRWLRQGKRFEPRPAAQMELLLYTPEPKGTQR